MASAKFMKWLESLNWEPNLNVGLKIQYLFLEIQIKEVRYTLEVIMPKAGVDMTEGQSSNGIRKSENL